jgi:hypothetical protein
MGLDSSFDITHRASGFLAWRLQADALIDLLQMATSLHYQQNRPEELGGGSEVDRFRVQFSIGCSSGDDICLKRRIFEEIPAAESAYVSAAACFTAQRTIGVMVAEGNRIRSF